MEHTPSARAEAPGCQRAFVYAVTHVVSNRHYVGKTIDVEKRWAEHRNSTSRTDSRFGRALAKYGPAAFQWRVLEECASEDEALKSEAKWIEVLQAHTREHGFNLRTGVRGGMRHAQETCEKIRAALSGRTLSEAQKQHLSEVNRGKRPSAETRLKLSAARMGKPRGPMSEETKRKLSVKAKARCEAGLLPMLGRKHTEATKAKLRGPRGPRGPISEEQRCKRTANWANPDFRERMLSARRKAREEKKNASK